MSCQDPISDLLTRIRNAYAVSKKSTTVKKSNVNKAILAVLADQGSIKGYGDHEDPYCLTVELLYSGQRPAMKKIQRSSKPSLRVYHKASQMPRIKSGLAYGIVSTNKGLMTTHQAKNQNLGGELICIVE